MDKPRSSNPLLQPADEVLKSVIYLEGDINFKILVSWIGACYGAAVNMLPNVKDDVQTRWIQGQCQALLLVNRAFSQAREELLARKAEFEKNQLPRNP
jgi:hypothetical protein